MTARKAPTRVHKFIALVLFIAIAVPVAALVVGTLWWAAISIWRAVAGL